MALVVDEELPNINYATYSPEEQPEVEGSVWGAAFRLENDVVNIIDYLTRPTFAPGLTFDFEAKAKASPWFQHNPEAFMGAVSDEDWAYRELRLEKEVQDRALVGQAGWGGILASVAAGVLSPTILIPVAGEYKAGGSAMMAAGRAAGWTMFGASLQEGVLQVNQEERTFAESAIGISSAAVLGGLLGSAIHYSTKAEIDKAVAGIAATPNTATISPLTPRSAVGLSAQATPAHLLEEGATSFRDPGAFSSGVGLPSIIEKFNLQDTFGFKQVHDFFSLDWMGPVTRGLASKSAVRRGVISQFSGAGMRMKLAQTGEAVVDEGTIEALVKQHEAKFAQTVKTQRRLFVDWYRSTGRGGVLRSMIAKHSYSEFLELTGEVMFKITNKMDITGEAPELVKAANFYLDNLFREELKAAREIGIDSWVKLSDETLALRIAMQRVRYDLVAKNYNDAERIMIENAKMVMRGRVKDEQFLAGVQGVFGKRRYAKELDEQDLDDFAEEIARQLLPILMGEHGRHGGVDILHRFGESAAPFLYIDPTISWAAVGGKTWASFLEKDVEKVGFSFMRSMSSDIELFRKFGVTTPAEVKGADVIIKESKTRPFWSQFQDEQHARRQAAEAITDPKKKEKELVAIANEARDFKNDLAGLVGRIRHTHGMPANPSGFFSRLGRGVSQLNTMRLMGGVVLSAISDPARMVMKAGVLNTFKHGFLPLFSNFSAFKMATREAQYAGTALDLLNHARSSMLFDSFNALEHGSMLEKGMDFATNKMGIVALFDYWNTYMKQFAASVWSGTLMDALHSRSLGEASRWQTEMLAQLGIDESVATALWRKITKEGGGDEVHPGIWMPNTDEWSEVSDETIDALLDVELAELKKTKKSVTKRTREKLRYEIFRREHEASRKLQRTLRAALSTLVDDTIVTPGVERPLWVDGSTAGRLVAQFRSFTLSSTMKVAMAMSQDARIGRMAPVTLGTMFSLALGSLSYYTWATAVGGRTQDRMKDEFAKAGRGEWEGIGRILDESLDRAGLLGVFSEVQKFAERVPATAPYVRFAGRPSTRSPYVNPVMDILGPTSNVVKNLGTIAMTFDDPTTGTFRAVRQLTPYQNVFWFRRSLDDIDNAIAAMAGLDQ